MDKTYYLNLREDLEPFMIKATIEAEKAFAAKNAAKDDEPPNKKTKLDNSFKNLEVNDRKRRHCRK